MRHTVILFHPSDLIAVDSWDWSPHDTWAMAHEMPAVRRAGGIQVRKLAIVAVIACSIVLFFVMDLGRFLSLETLKANRDHLLAFTEANYTASVVLFVLLYIAVAGLSLLGPPS